MLDKENASNRSRSLAGVGLLGRALKTRRLARCSVAVLLLGLLAAATYVYLVDDYADVAYGQTPPDPPLPEPGAPRPWEAGIQVSTYCTLNTRTSNLLTGIPLVGWTGRGPAISMALYHNSSLPVNQAMGFDMGPGWTVSYSSYIELDDPQNPTTATVIADDAMLTKFTDDNGWQAPAGVHDILTQDGDTWLLTHRDQSYHQYQQDVDGVIRLKKIGDAAGNYLAVSLDPWHTSDLRLKEITDISGRKLEFIFDANDRLEKIKDPREAVEPPYGNGEFLEDREWVFTYDVDGRLDTITDPAGDRINLDYDTPGRIILITDKYGAAPYHIPDEYEFAYDTGGDVRLEVTDPLVGGNRLTQQFSLTATVDTITGTYTDQRQNEWEHQYTVVSYPDANLTQLENPLGETRHFSYDTDRNAEEYWFGAHPNDKWAYTYDDRGNILTGRDPLQHTKEWTYDQHNNVTSYTDAIGNTVEFWYDYEEFFLCSFMTQWHCGTCVGGGSAGSPCDGDLDCDGGSCETDDDHCKYCDPSTSPEQYWYEPCDTDDDCGGGTCLSDACQARGYPALLTRIIEPPTEEGGDPGITTLDYYVQFDLDRCQSGGMNACGHLKEVIDPNDVWTGFEYDQWGQLLVYNEGDVSGTRSDPVLSSMTKRNSAGELVESKRFTDGGRAESGCGGVEWSLRGVASIVCKECLVRAGDRQQAPRAPGIPDGPDLPMYYADWSVPNPDTTGYSPKGDLLHLLIRGKRWEDILEYTREFSYAYDAYGRLTSATINSDEWDSQPSTRTFTHQHDTANGQYTRTGPDGVRTFVQLDALGRTDHYERGPEGSPIMSADFDYYAHGLLETVQYSNYTSVHYGYDAGLRLTSVDHQNLSGTIRKLQYEYYDNDLISKITESDIIGPKAIVKFKYDSRGRLVLEARMGQDPYHMAYEYDQGGNRTRKIRSLGGCNRIETVYHYDYEDPYSGSYNNRLMYYETYEMCRVFEDYGHTGGCGSEELVSTTWYYYHFMTGNAVYVVTAKADPEPEEPKYSGTRLKYARNGAAVTFALGISWDPYAPKYDIDWAREFRYDSPQQRYMNIQLDPKDLEGGVIDPISTVWSDYDRNEIYGDFEIDSQSITELRSFEPGTGKFSWDVGVPDPATAKYYHTDMIGTTRFMTDSTGDDIESAVHTAFGERVSGTQHRYGYAGAWGYQTHDDLSFLHVGHRYYDPATGRFLQRDPIGIEGGLNVYVYVQNNPLFYIDPSGLGPKWDWIKDKAKKIWDVAKRLPPYILPSSPVPADAAPDMACIYLFGAYREHIEDSHDDNLPDENCPTCNRLQPK